MAVTAHTGFVAPLNLTILSPGTLCDAWIFIIQPVLNHFRFLLISPMQWELRGVATTLEVFTNRSNRHENTTALADKSSHRINHTVRKPANEFVGHLIGHQGAN